MTAAPAIKGWCPTLLSPMQSGDGWLARVKPSAGVLSAAAARLIADAARRHGNGHIDLTSRANLQIRGLSASLGGRLRRDDHHGRSGQYQPIAGSDPQCHGEPAWARRSLCRLRLSCRCARHRSHALRRARALGAAVQIRYPRRWRRRAAACRHHRRHHGARARGEACRPPRRRDARCACATRILAHRNREGSWRSPSFACPRNGARSRAACARW